MSLRRLNGVWQYATGTGTGALTLGNAVAAKWRRLQDTVMADGDKFRARILRRIAGLKGTISAGTMTGRWWAIGHE